MRVVENAPQPNIEAKNSAGEMQNMKSLGVEYSETVENPLRKNIVGHIDEFDKNELKNLPLPKLKIFVDHSWIHCLFDASDTHGDTIGGVRRALTRCLDRACSDPATDYYISCHSHETLVQNKIGCHGIFTMQPDDTYAYFQNGRTFEPTIAVEVAVFNEDLSLLIAECSTLLNDRTSFVYCIGVKYLADRIIFFVCEATVREKPVAEPEGERLKGSKEEKLSEEGCESAKKPKIEKIERSFLNCETQAWQDYFSMRVICYEEITEARDIEFELDLERISIVDGEPQEHGMAIITIPRAIVQSWLNIWEKDRALRNPTEK